MTPQTTFLPTARPTPAEAAAALRRRAAMNDRYGNVGRAWMLRDWADRLIAATRRPD